MKHVSESAVTLSLIY